MIITCIGHAKFLLELDDGMRIVTDPYDASCGYPVEPMQADVAFVSHGHRDHNAVDTLTGLQKVVDTAGEHLLAPGVKVRAVASFHDDVQGAKRGANLMFVLEAEGLRVAHLGDLGHMPTEAQLEELGPIDVLMTPVGGFFTIDAPAAKKVAELVHARVVVPMHYRTDANAGWPIAPLDGFLALYENAAEWLPLLRVTAGDLSEQPHVAVLEPQTLK